jgi:hypothetical protein
VPVSSTQLGAIGESLLFVYATRGSDGELEFFPTRADDDGRDASVSRRGSVGSAFLQIKTADALDQGRYVRARARFPQDQLPAHPAFLFVVLLVPTVTIECAWLVPGPDFARLAYRYPDGPRHVQLIVTARPDGGDRWAPYLVPPTELGSRLVRSLHALERTRQLLLRDERPPWIVRASERT